MRPATLVQTWQPVAANEWASMRLVTIPRTDVAVAVR